MNGDKCNNMVKLQGKYSNECGLTDIWNTQTFNNFNWQRLTVEILKINLNKIGTHYYKNHQKL